MAKNKKKIVLPQGDPAAIAERFKDFPAMHVLSRRFENPNDPGSLPILLKGEPDGACASSDHMNRLKPGATKCHLCKKPVRLWFVYWFNLAKEGRNAQMRSKGYIPVEISELKDADDISDLYRSQEDRFVRRGDRGQEILGKIPLEAYNYIKGKQREAWNAGAMSGKKLRESIAENVASDKDFSKNALEREEAAEAIHAGGVRVERMQRTKSTLGDEAGADA